MSDSSRHDRLLELLADRALVGLDATEETELAALLQEFPDEDADAFERAAAAAMLAHMGKVDALPQQLAARIEAQTPRKKLVDAPIRIAPSSLTKKNETTPQLAKPDRFRAAGWVAAAACLALAIYALRGRPPARQIADATSGASKIAPAASNAKALAALRTQLAVDPLATKIAWTATDDPGGKGVTGDVVFSVDKQTGFMRFHGLAANDPKQHQYQLWIFDKAQDAKYPIDGGVFDVDASTGDVIVQIEPKIRVTGPTLFAVTIEAPGGVVVSKREHIIVTAKI